MFKYERHDPKKTLLYKIIEEHYPVFVSNLAEEGRELPSYVRTEFEDYLKCGLLEYGFLRVLCEDCHHERMLAFSCKHRGFCPSCCAKRMTESSSLLVDNVLPRQPMRQWVSSFPIPLRFLFAREPHVMGKVLGIVYRTIATYLIKKTGYKKNTARTGAVTFIQRFGSALNLNIHFHMLFLDGVFINAKGESAAQRFIPVFNHRSGDMVKLTHKVSSRIARYLERTGLIESDAENSYLAEGVLTSNEMNEHQGFSVNYRIAVGSQKGKKVFALQTLPPGFEDGEGKELLGKMAGFSLHAGVAAYAGDRDKLERLCRYVARPSVSVHRLSLTSEGHIRYELKTPYHNGTTHMIFDPLDFISKLASLIPAPRVNLTRFHGVFAPNSQYRARIINRQNNQKLGVVAKQIESEEHGAMNWAMRLKRAFNIDMNTCEACGGAAKVIACIDNPIVIEKILKSVQSQSHHTIPSSRAPPAVSQRLALLQ